MYKITILTTGGTIEKTYDETDGLLRNVSSALDEILTALRLPDLSINHVRLMNKDSLEMTETDRQRILRAVHNSASGAVLILHGTDTLAQTGEYLNYHLPEPDRPVVLTGAMRPFEFRDSDAQQNITESLAACRLLPPGVFAVMHNQVLRFPGVVKDMERLTLGRG